MDTYPRPPSFDWILRGIVVAAAVPAFVLLMEALTGFDGEWVNPHGFGASPWRAFTVAAAVSIAIEAVALPNALRFMADNQYGRRPKLLVITGGGIVTTVLMIWFFLWAPL